MLAVETTSHAKKRDTGEYRLVVFYARVYFLFLLVAMLSLSLQARAQTGENDSSSGVFILEPAKIELSLLPGESKTQELSLTNQTAQTLTFSIGFEDVGPSDDLENPIVLLGEKVGEYSLARYISSSQTSLTVRPGERATIPITVTIPNDADPGGLYGAALIATGEERVGESVGGNARIVSRLGSLFFVRVLGDVFESGHLEDFRVSGPSRLFFDAHSIAFEMLFSNDGNVHLTPYGVLQIRNIWGRVLEEIQIEPYFALPGSERSRVVRWNSPEGVGPYSAVVYLNRGYGDLVDEQSLTFWMMPWDILALSAFAVAVFAVVLYLIASRSWFRRRAVIPLAALLLISSLAGSAGLVRAQVMQSSNYRIQSDSANVGGAPSESTNYGIEDTTGEIATGPSESATYRVKAGYQQMLESFISISSPSDATLSAMDGTAGDAGTGTVSWTIITDNLAGYTLSAKASTDPALQGTSENFSDYTPAGADPDFSFSVGASAAEFGFSPEGVDITQRFKDNGAACNVGALDTSERCWAGFSTTAQTIVSRSSSNHPAGTGTTLALRAEVGASASRGSGTYSATITATATAQ